MREGVIESRAPARINDLGGWTDTWFSRHGNVLSISVLPGASCHLGYARRQSPGRKSFTLDVRDFNERYSFDPGNTTPGRHPLLEATVAHMGIPSGVAVEALVESGLPPGCGTGTSAAVAVALIGALDALTPERSTRDCIWRTAHRVETDVLGWESGIQDQICATYGGICFIEIQNYPEARISPVELRKDQIKELESRLILVYLGESHRSSEVHQEVISGLTNEDSETGGLRALREIPVRAREALANGRFASYGRLMVENTEGQRALHPGLISPEADRVIRAAEESGALGWKVNGAGGQGGSLTLLTGDKPAEKSKLIERLGSINRGISAIPVRIDLHGLTVNEIR